MGKMSLTSCRALSTPGKFSNVDRYVTFLVDIEGYLVELRQNDQNRNFRRWSIIPLIVFKSVYHPDM